MQNVIITIKLQPQHLQNGGRFTQNLSTSMIHSIYHQHQQLIIYNVQTRAIIPISPVQIVPYHLFMLRVHIH